VLIIERDGLGVWRQLEVKSHGWYAMLMSEKADISKG